MSRLLFILVLGLSSCMTTRSRPCSSAGDTTWYPPVVGNMKCTQKADANGNLLNQGHFQQWYPSGALALEGTFEAGKKNGLWVQYDPKGNRIAEKWFESGIERSLPATEKKK